MTVSTTQESYKENNIAQLLKDLDKYAKDSETIPVTAKSSKDDIYLKFTELLLNLGKHQKSWDAFKNVVDSSIQKMRKDTSKLNKVVYNDLLDTGLPTEEERAAKRSGAAPSYYPHYQAAFSTLEADGKKEPYKAADLLAAFKNQKSKTGRPTTPQQIKKQLQKLARLNLISGDYNDPK